MREITTRELYGHLFNSMIGSRDIINVIDLTGGVTTGRVTGYSIGGYRIDGKIIVETVQLYNAANEMQYFIPVMDIDVIQLPDK